ncbi:MAG: type II secretion system protein [Thermoguttaceae bacterium]|nr:type II secretion system protein [Thermoguttaceae bacterium]MBQ2683639.1 type II secretion system protein [Thermoguttaceae bacterium]MBQ3454375.1 type II secretion system protein [Thermoguttaceae bacterium]
MSARFRHQQERRGFTLVELLTVIIIIALLATLGLAVQRASVESARRSRTQTTITKIDHVLSAIYEKYQYRKVALPDYSDAQLDGILGDSIIANYVNNGEPDKAEQARRTARMIARTRALRELLVMDMPTNVGEMMDEALNPLPPEYAEKTPLSNLYYKLVTAQANPLATTNAELLYMIVMNADPEARTLFHDREIGVWEDGERTGGKVFLDGWGNPICFLRWAPGLVDSDRQPNLSEGLLIQCFQRAHSEAGLASLDPEVLNLYDMAFTAWEYPSDSLDARVTMLEQDQKFRDLLDRYGDPLDPMGVADGWYLTPLVYSWGPDGEPGMRSPNDALFSPSCCVNPFMIPYIQLGLQDFADLNSETYDDQYAKDNITNHSAVEN